MNEEWPVAEESLGDLLGDSDEAMAVANTTENLVRTFLLTQYPFRGRYALRQLASFWGAEVYVVSAESDDYVFAYIAFPPRPCYFHVATYDLGTRVVENPPDEEEFHRWHETAN